MRLLIAALLCSGSVLASTPEELLDQTLEMLRGTIYVLPHRETADGRLIACGLEFSALDRDRSTKQGAPVRLVGSYYFRTTGETDGGVAAVLKLGVYDGLQTENATRPAKAFVRAARGFAPEQTRQTQADNPGFGLFVSGLDDSAVKTYQAITEERKFVVGFNRKPGQQDVAVTIDLTVEDTAMEGEKVKRTRSTHMVDDFNACVGDLLK